jgi:MFS family permease
MLVFVTGSMSLSALVSVSGQLQEEFGLSDGQIGLLTSVFMGFYGLAAVLSGPFASRWGGRLLLVTCGTFFVGSLILGMSPSFGCLLAGRAIQGIGGGTVVPVCNPLMSQAVSPERIRRCWAVFGCGWGIGQMAALLIMPAVARVGGFRAVFFAIAGLAMIAGVGALSQRVVRALPNRSESSLGSRAMAASLLRVAKNRRLLLLGVVCIAHLAIPVGIVAWTPSFLGEYRGAAPGLAAYLIAGLGACQVLGSLAGAALAGKVGKHRVILGSLGTMTLAVGLIAIVPGRMAAVTMVLLAGFCSFTLFPPMISYISEVVGKQEDVGAATGVHAVIGFVGALAAPWIFGQVLDAGTRSNGSYVLGYLVLVAFGVAAVAGIATFRPHPTTDGTTRPPVS